MPRAGGRWCGNKSVSLEVQRTVKRVEISASPMALSKLIEPAEIYSFCCEQQLLNLPISPNTLGTLGHVPRPMSFFVPCTTELA